MEAPLRARCLPPVRGDNDRSGLQTRAASLTPERLPRGAGPAAKAAVRCPAEGRGGVSADTHLPGRHCARVPGGRSAGMVRAPRVHSVAGATSRASPQLRSFPRAAPARGLGRAWDGVGAGPGAGPPLQRHLLEPRRRCSLRRVRPEVPGVGPRRGRGGAEREVRDTVPTPPVLSSPDSPRACPGPQWLVGAGLLCRQLPDLLLCSQEALGLMRWHPSRPTPGAQVKTPSGGDSAEPRGVGGACGGRGSYRGGLREQGGRVEKMARGVRTSLVMAACPPLPPPKVEKAGGVVRAGSNPTDSLSLQVHIIMVK